MKYILFFCLVVLSISCHRKDRSSQIPLFDNLSINLSDNFLISSRDTLPSDNGSEKIVEMSLTNLVGDSLYIYYDDSQLL